MSTATELWKKWEGLVVDGKFPLRQWLGGSDHSAVFLTERSGEKAKKFAVKLIPAGNLRATNLDQDAQLFRWADAAKLAHPHLIRLFEYGRCQIDDTRLLYVVMEYAEENLAEILPLRPLSAEEASEMLRPTAEALASLHQAGFTHGRIKPSNIMAVDNQLKISADGLCKIGERGGARPPSAYDAPEVATTGPSTASDVWSLGMTLVAVLTQKETQVNSGEQEPVAVPEMVPQPFREIARRCLMVDPQRRCTLDEILSKTQPPASQDRSAAGARAAEAHTPREHQRRWIVVSVVVVALFLVTFLGIKFMGHQPAVPAAETHPSSPPANIPATQSPAPFSEKKKPAQKGLVRGSVLQQVQPDVSRSAQNTITGRFRVSVQVQVDASGDVTQAKVVSPGPSIYFANHALAAARQWKFNPPQVDGQAAASEWMLRFQFSRASTQVFPAETKP
ncbi:MAG TPA: TonB family protein [Candidatus Acidoferrum sp.]|jgi:TonB family protein|nr:TonB family protein [Candidatus Acidoferrum sp.]